MSSLKEQTRANNPRRLTPIYHSNMTFKKYLKQRGHAPVTIHNTERSVLDFLTWLDKQNMEAEQVRHADLLAYIHYHQKKQLQQQTIERYLNAIRQFYGFQVSIGAVKSNPVTGIKLQGIQRRKLYYTFSAEELNAIYNGYPVVQSQGEQFTQRRNKVMLGLYVYQGIQTAELVKMEVGDIDLRAGEITIPATRRSNTRTLQLKAHQVLDIYDYVLQIRPKILAISGQQTQQLFVSPKGGTDQTNYVYALMKELKKHNKRIQNAQQLRTSVIIKWLKQYNLREVQYRAGHKYVSSTESYRVNETQGLAEEIIRFHPLG